MKELLDVRNLHISFSSKKKIIRAVRGASFSLYTGETVGIVGESGAGKSVLAKSLLRLLPSFSTQIEKGEVFYKGEELLSQTENKIRSIRGKEISMIFQDPMSSLNPTMKIGAQIIEGYKLHHKKASRKEVLAKGLELLNRVGIPDPEIRYEQYPHELSGGMRQRVMIAIAMIASPSLLIADEPTTALDVTIQMQILTLLKEIQQKENTTILFITHDLGIVAGFCDRVLVMYAGKIVESALTETLFSSPKHPYTQLLLKAIPRLDSEAKQPLYTIHGTPPDLSLLYPGCSFAPRCPKRFDLCAKKAPSLLPVEESQEVSCHLYHNVGEKDG
ncbi:MAG: ABC transporter ATP-binding protein [Simkania negevensis]|nr:ABC transporter ATP-binding protein [Simkania negevensis]